MEWNGAEVTTCSTSSPVLPMLTVTTKGSLKTGHSYDAHATPHEDVGVLIYDENTKVMNIVTVPD